MFIINHIMRKKALMLLLASMLVGVLSAQEDEFSTKSLSEMTKKELKTMVEDGNKENVITFQRSDGKLGAFDANGVFLGFYGGCRYIDGDYRGVFTASFVVEKIPLFRKNARYYVSEDGRIKREYRHPLSAEVTFSYAERAYVNSKSQGRYYAPEIMGYIKAPIPGFEKWTYDRFTLNVCAGIGAIKSQYDTDVKTMVRDEKGNLVEQTVYTYSYNENGDLVEMPLEFINDAFGLKCSALLEGRWRFNKQLASALVFKAGVSMYPQQKLNETLMKLKPELHIGFQFAAAANHRVVDPNRDNLLSLLDGEYKSPKSH
jgi:hypothetical protein